MEALSLIQKLAVLALPLILAITVHEAAHGFVADRLGDKTARMLGRITLNPIKHIDPVGTVLVPLALFAFTGFIIGWAKPVPVDPRNFRNPRRDMALVAVAGPLSNLLMAIVWGLLVFLGQALLSANSWLAEPLIYMGAAGVLINVILMVLNLIPLPPLDGGRVVAGLLPAKLADGYGRLEPYGMFILIGLLVTGILGRVMWPLVIFAIVMLPGSTAVLNIFLH